MGVVINPKDTDAPGHMAFNETEEGAGVEMPETIVRITLCLMNVMLFGQT
jgi:hypothetical protein